MSVTPTRRRVAYAALAASVVAAVSLAATPAYAAEDHIVGADRADRVAGSYIVVLKDSASVGATSRRLTNRHGGEVTYRYRDALRGFAVSTNERSARRMAADSAVAYVEVDQRVHTTGTQTNPPSWGLDRIDQRNLPLDDSYTYPNTAGNVHAYIIDTGIRITHNDFGGRATWGTNTVDNNNTDCNGHGTHVAGTVGGSAHGVAKATQLVAVKVLNCQGSGTISGVVAGVDWVTNNANKPAVANMSLGGGANSTLDNAVTNSINSGVTYAVAAGNSNADACDYSPARTAAAITVGATTSSDSRSSFSNWGTCLDIFAPGSSITSAWNTSDTATNTISGTSMASPHAAGAAALVLSANTTWSPKQVRDYLVANATDGVVSSPGSGSPNKLLYVVNDDDPGDPGDCTGAGQKLTNPGFESGGTGWTVTNNVIGQWGSSGQPPHSGTWNAWFNGYGAENVDWLYQNVTLPSGCTSYTLSFWMHIDTDETTTSTAYDRFWVQVLTSDGSSVLKTLAVYSNLDANTGYVKKSFSLDPWAGQTIRIRWYGYEDVVYYTSFVIDDTAVNVS